MWSSAMASVIVEHVIHLCLALIVLKLHLLFIMLRTVTEDMVTDPKFNISSPPSSFNFIDTLPAGLQSQSLVKSWMWETRNWKTTVSKLGIVVNCALWTIGDSLELSNWYFHLAQFWYSDKEVISWTARWNRTSSAKSLAWYVLWDLS